MSETVRPTKKQRDILTYIEQFIVEHGYSPSYREIMNGLNYTSVATVSLHVNSLIRRGHLLKRDRSARSLEVVSDADASAVNSQSPSVNTELAPEKWLVNKVDSVFKNAEQSEYVVENSLDELAVLLSALKILGLETTADSFAPRLAALQTRIVASPVTPEDA